MNNRPQIAIIDPNTLSALGLKAILQNVMPIMTVDTYGSFAELTANNPEQYFHYFVAMNVVLENKAFFSEHRRKTIVLTLSLDSTSQLSEFHSLCINVPEQELIRSLLALEQHAHGNGQHLPPMPKALQQKILTDREIAEAGAALRAPVGGDGDGACEEGLQLRMMRCLIIRPCKKC